VPLGRCVLERACVGVPHETLSGIDDLEAKLAAGGVFFEGIPGYHEVQLHVLGTEFPDCQISPTEDALFCGLSQVQDLSDPSAFFGVVMLCGSPDCPQVAPACAGADL
jgi:hypothetical protein